MRHIVAHTYITNKFLRKNSNHCPSWLALQLSLASLSGGSCGSKFWRESKSSCGSSTPSLVCRLKIMELEPVYDSWCWYDYFAMRRSDWPLEASAVVICPVDFVANSPWSAVSRWGLISKRFRLKFCGFQVFPRIVLCILARLINTNNVLTFILLAGHTSPVSASRGCGGWIGSNSFVQYLLSSLMPRRTWLCRAVEALFWFRVKSSSAPIEATSRVALTSRRAYSSHS